MKRWPLERQKVSSEIEEGGEPNRPDGADQPRSHDRRDGVGRIVEAIEKVKRKRDQDKAGEQREG